MTARKAPARKAGTRTVPKGARGLLRERTPLEISVLTLALLAIGAVVAVLIGADARLPDGAPDLRVSVTPMPAPASGGAPYEVSVRNEGGETAENVEIDVTVGSETRTLGLTAVGRGDEERGVVVFPASTTGRAEAEVVSFSEPAR